MALEEGDIATITQIVQDALKGQNDKGNDKGNGNEPDGGDTQKIKDDAAKAKTEAAVLKSALAFNIGRDKMLADNKRFIPDTVNTIFKAYVGRQYKDDVEEANNYRKVILEEVFSDQKNIDIMPESAKAKIAAFNNLAESDKLNKAGEYYDLIDTYLTIKKGQSQAEFNKQGQSGTDAYAEKFQKLGDVFTKKGA